MKLNRDDELGVDLPPLPPDTRTLEQKLADALAELRMRHPEAKSDVKFHEVSADLFEREDLLRLVCYLFGALDRERQRWQQRMDEEGEKLMQQLRKARALAKIKD